MSEMKKEDSYLVLFSPESQVLDGKCAKMRFLPGFVNTHQY